MTAGCRRERRTALCSKEVATSRNEKIPPPWLSATTTVRSGANPSARTRAETSWRKARSPTRATAGPPVATATPQAVDTTPSMPLTPRLASTLAGVDRRPAYDSTSRMGIDADTTSAASPGSVADQPAGQRWFAQRGGRRPRWPAPGRWPPAARASAATQSCRQPRSGPPTRGPPTRGPPTRGRRTARPPVGRRRPGRRARRCPSDARDRASGRGVPPPSTARRPTPPGTGTG